MDGERRSCARDACLISAHVRDGSRLYDGTLLDISEHGTYLAARAPLEPGTEVQLRFRHPRTESIASVPAVVMRRVRPGESGGCEPGVGLAFLHSLTRLESVPDRGQARFPADPTRLQQLRTRALSGAS